MLNDFKCFGSVQVREVNDPALLQVVQSLREQLPNSEDDIEVFNDPQNPPVGTIEVNIYRLNVSEERRDALCEGLIALGVHAFAPSQFEIEYGEDTYVLYVGEPHAVLQERIAEILARARENLAEAMEAFKPGEDHAILSSQVINEALAGIVEHLQERAGVELEAPRAPHPSGVRLRA